MKSKVDIVFLAIFFTFLFIPMCHINNEKISKEENRTLAVVEPLIKDKKINFNFTNSVNNWFHDRFFLRKQFIALHSKIYKIFYLNKKPIMVNGVIFGKEDWLFLGWKASIKSYQNARLLSDKELKEIDEYLKNINDFCIKNNKKFLFVIAPDKSRIYPEFYNDKIKKKGDYSTAQQLVDYISEHSKTPSIYLKDTLISKKGKNLLYFKQDTHWNLLGAYWGYLDIANALKIEPYRVKKYETVENFGDLNGMLNKSFQIKKSDKYAIPDISDINTVCETTKPDNITITKCANSKKELNLLMYRDSFSLNLISYLSYSFKNSTYIWKYDIKTQDIENYDVVKLEIVERELPSLPKKVKGIK